MAGPDKSNQNRLPLHPALRCAQGPFAPSPLQGPAYKGHPWPFKPLAASMRLAPLRNDSTHPSERGGWCCLAGRAKKAKASNKISNLPGNSDPRPRQEAEWRCRVGGREAGRRASHEGTSLSLRDVPPERRRSEGSFAQQNPDVGCPSSLVTFLLGKQQESDSAGWPKPEPPTHAVICPDPQSTNLDELRSAFLASHQKTIPA